MDDKKVKGTLKSNGVHLKEHEYATVKLLLENGYDVELIPPQQIGGVHTPDIILQGLSWEIKAPIGCGKKNIENTIQTASKQSSNIIIDLRRSKMPELQAIREIEKQGKLTKRIRHIKIVNNNSEIIDIS